MSSGALGVLDVPLKPAAIGPGDAYEVNAMSAAQVAGRPVIISGDDRTVRMRP